MSKTYEYLTTPLKADSAMNEMGDDGWELCGVYTSSELSRSGILNIETHYMIWKKTHETQWQGGPL